MFLDLNKKKVFTLEAGSFFGEQALLEHRPRNAYVKTKTECEILILPKSAFEEVVATPKVMHTIKATADRRSPPSSPRRAQPAEELMDGEVDRITLLLNVPLFATMPDTVHCSKSSIRGLIERLAPHLQKVEVAKGKYIVRQGDLGDCMFFISEGAAVGVSGVQDRVLFELRKGDCIGEMALLFRERSAWRHHSICAISANNEASCVPGSGSKSVRASQNSVLYKLTASSFMSCLQQYPDVSESLLYMAEKRRVAHVRGTGGIPSAFQKMASVVCENDVEMEKSTKKDWQTALPISTLRRMLGEHFIMWSNAQIDELLAGDGMYILSALDHQQRIDYNKVLRKADQVGKKSLRSSTCNINAEKWQGWKRMFSTAHQTFYYWNESTHASQWEAPPMSIWSSQKEDGAQRLDTAKEAWGGENSKAVSTEKNDTGTWFGSEHEATPVIAHNGRNLAQETFSKLRNFIADQDLTYVLRPGVPRVSI